MKKSNGKVKEESAYMPSLTEVSLQVCKVLFNIYYESGNFRLEKKWFCFYDVIRFNLTRLDFLKFFDFNLRLVWAFTQENKIEIS